MTRLAPALPAKRAVPRDGPHGAHHEPVVPRLDDPRLARLQAGIDDDTRERRLADELIHHHVDGEARGRSAPTIARTRSASMSTLSTTAYGNGLEKRRSR